MKGVVKYHSGEGFVELREIESALPGPDQVKVEVRAVGVCGSDLHIYHDDIGIPVVPPVVLGHEFSGVVLEKGARVGESVEIGDRVTGESNVSWCGTCRYCLEGYYNLCSDRRVLGYSSHGAYAQYCNVRTVHKLPDEVGFEAGSITEPLACCVHGVLEQTGISAGDFVAVLGPGPVGILASLVARSAGATVALIGMSADAGRLHLAGELGVQHPIGSEGGEAIKEVRGMTGGYGADVVIECSGSVSGARMGIEMARKRGKYAQIGLFGRSIEIDFEQIAFRELRVSGSISQRRPSWETALELMSTGEIPVERLISHDLPLAEWKHAFDLVEKRQCLKIVLLP